MALLLISGKLTCGSGTLITRPQLHFFLATLSAVRTIAADISTYIIDDESFFRRVMSVSFTLCFLVLSDQFCVAKELTLISSY